MNDINKNLLPKGRVWGLNISYKLSDVTGPFVDEARWKLVWHTTEGESLNGAVDAVRAKRSEPHVVINPSTGTVVQMQRLREYAKTLKHPPGTPETNRAKCVQVEIVGYAREAGLWPVVYYRRLAALAVLLEHRCPIPRVAGHRFEKGARRITPEGFVRARGHVGHQHVPHNDHWDPGAFRISTLFECMKAYDDR